MVFRTVILPLIIFKNCSLLYVVVCIGSHGLKCFSSVIIDTNYSSVIIDTNYSSVIIDTNNSSVIIDTNYSSVIIDTNNSSVIIIDTVLIDP